MQQYGKVKRLAKRLHEGEVVQLRDIAAVLGKQAITDFRSEWQSEIDYRKALANKPKIVKDYEAIYRLLKLRQTTTSGLLKSVLPLF